MGLASVMQTGLSGISAAEVAIGVAANNLANWQTPGFKASRVVCAAQVPQTTGLGTAPSGNSGGGNPIQVGTGVRVAAITADFTQGAVALDSDPLSLALQGDGLFILEGPGGERLYSRDGRFGLNADGELVSAGGRRVLGYGVDENFQIQRTRLEPIKIPRGGQAAGRSRAAAVLTGFSITRDGRVRGRFSDGTVRDLAQIRIARFANPSGLDRRGDNLYAPGPNSGLPVESNPGEPGAGEVVAGAVELSNTDVGRSLIDLGRASLQLRVGVRLVLAADALLAELMSLRRRA